LPVETPPDLTIALPEIFLAIAALTLLMVGVFLKRANESRTISFSCIAVLILAIPLVISVSNDRMTTFGGAFIVDEFSAYIKILVLLSAAAIILISKDYLKIQLIDLFEFPVLIILATLGMMMMISANDLLGVYLGIELQSLSLYILAAFQKSSSRSAESGLKYFVLGALSSGLMLYGMSMIYGFAGTTGFDELSRIFSKFDDGPVFFGVTVGIVFIAAGFAFKVSSVPFHMWTPDVYEGAPTPATALFSAAPKIAAMGLFVRTAVGPFSSLSDQWQQIIVFMSVSSMILGAFAAINQKNIKRMLAYSSIGHMGYALIGLAAAGVGGNIAIQTNGVRAVLVYLGIYIFMNIGTFACVLLMKRDGRMVEGIDDLAGLSKNNPGLALTLSIFMFSMAGIPPMAGFLGKLYVFEAAINAELYALAIIGVLASVVGAFYYIRIIKVIYFDPPVEPLDISINLETRSVLVISGFVVVFLIFFPLPLINSAEQAATALFSN